MDTNDSKRKPSQLNKQVIRFGTHKVTIYQRGDVIDSSYYFRIHIKEEDRFYRKSLQTADRTEAREKAQSELIDLLSKLKTGQRILALSLHDLIKRYSLNQQAKADSGELSPNTVMAQRYRIGLAEKFLIENCPAGLETKITSIDGELFRQYLDWRTKNVAERGKTIRRDVVRDELLTIRKMFLFAKENRSCTEKSIPNWDFSVEREGAKRERITNTQFKDFINTTNAWAKEAMDPKDSYHRRGLMQVIGLVSLSGMRSGEVFGLKNKDIQARGRNQFVISIRAETSKVRRSRVITVHSDLLGIWLRKSQLNKESGDHVFSPKPDGTTPFRDVFYHLFTSLRVRLKEIDLDWFDLYHCRHWYITNRLYAEEPIHHVAKACGTSVKEIEATYSHVLTEMTTARFAQKKLEWNPDGSYKIIKVLES